MVVNRRLVEQFQLRLPDGMRGRLKEAGDRTGRSTNAEIVERLRQSLDDADEGVRKVWLPSELWDRIEHEAQTQETDPNLVVVTRLEETFSDRQREVVHGNGQVISKTMFNVLFDQVNDDDLLHLISGAVETLRARRSNKPRRPWKKD